MAKSKHPLEERAAYPQNGHGAGLPEPLSAGHEKCDAAIPQSENGDRMSPGRISKMDFTKLTIREVLEYFLRSGDELAWTEFRRRTRPTIRGGCAATLKQHATDDLLNDLEQDAYAKLIANDYRVLRNLVWHDENSIFKYVKAVARNVAFDWLRRPRWDPEPIDSISLVAREVRPDHKIRLDEIDKCLLSWTSNENLERDRAMFWLYFRYGFTAKQIARLPSINLPVRKVENILQKLVRRVKNKLGKRGKGTSPD